MQGTVLGSLGNTKIDKMGCSNSRNLQQSLKGKIGANKYHTEQCKIVI